MALAPEEAESRLLAELLAAVDDTALTEAEYQDPEEFAAAVLNNLPAIAYALSAGMTVTRWRPLQRNVAEEQRILRAVRQWGEQARRLIVGYLQGTIGFDEFAGQLMAAYQQHARNAYVAGHRAVGDLAPLTAQAEDSLAALSDSDAKRLQDSITAPAAGGTVGVGALLRSMFSPEAIFTPSNYLGSGLPGDPFKNLPPPLGAGGHKAPRAPRVAPTPAPAIADGLKPLAEPLEDRDVASQAMRTYLDRVDDAGSLIGTYAKKGEIDALTQAIPAEAVLSWWVLGAADHCIDCVRLSEMSPYYASSLAADGLYPGSGHTRCGHRCQCHIEHHVPAEICTDPMKGPGSLGANPADLIESADGRRINVWVQEAASCRNPQSIDAFAAQNGLTAIAGEDPFNWSDDVATAMEADEPISYTDLTAQQQRAFGFLGDIVPGGRVEPLLATRYRLDGAEYHALWQRSGGALRFEAGATTAGIGALDPEFTLRAIHDLARIADREGLRLEVNGATRNAGMARWLDTIGAESGSIGGAAPALAPNFAEMDALAEQAMPKAGIAPAPGPAGKPGLDDAIARVAEAEPAPQAHPVPWETLTSHVPAAAAPGSAQIVEGPIWTYAVRYGPDGTPAAIAELGINRWTVKGVEHRELLDVETIRVNPALAGQGHASALYDWVQDSTDLNLYAVVGATVTEDGKAFLTKWLKHRKAIEPKPGIAPLTILPTPSFVDAAADAIPAWPDMGLLKVTPGAKALKGANPKKILVDPKGQEWLFKAGLAERPEADAAATEVARRLGLRVPPVQKVTWEGVAGTLQPIVPNAKALDRVIDMGQIGAEALDAEGMREVARQSVVDFVLANNDTHGGNWVLDGEGRLWGIDKGRSYVGGVVASMNPKGFFNPTGGMTTLMGGAVMFPERSHIWERLRPGDMAGIFNRLDGITAEEFGAISHDVLPLIANPFGTPQESLDVLLQRKAGARARFEQWFRDELDSPDAKPSPEWKAWRKAGGTFDVAPVAPAGQPERLLQAPPAAKPTPPEMRSSATFESRVGNDLGVLPSDFIPATTMPAALDRLAKALPKTTGNVTGGFSLGQVNAIIARAETMGDMGIDMGMLKRLGDFTLVPPADKVKGIGLTYKGDRIALNHDFRWKYLAGVDSPDTVYNDIGGLFAHEYGHVAFAHLGSEAQGKVIELYKAHAAEAGKDLSTYAAGDVDEWVGEMMAAVTTPGYVPGTVAYDDEFWTALVGDGAAKAKVKPTGAKPTATPGPVKQMPDPVKEPTYGQVRAALDRDFGKVDWTPLGDLDHDAVRQAMTTWVQLGDRFPKMRSKVTGLKVLPEHDALAEVNVGGNILTLNAAAFASPETLSAAAKAAGIAVPTPKGVIAHEFSHSLDKVIRLDLFERAIAAGVAEEAIGTYPMIQRWAKVRGDITKAKVSAYAAGAKNVDEGLAEAFSILYAGTPDQITPPIKALRDFLDDWQAPPKAATPFPLVPEGPPVKAPKQTWLKQGDAQQYLIPDTDLPVNVPAAQWSGYVPPEPPVPSVATAPEQHAANKAALAAAQQAHDAVVIDWHDVADGKAPVAFSWDKAETDKAVAAGLHVEKVGGQYVVAKGTQDLEPLKAFLAQGGDANSDDFWHLMGYSDSDLATYDAYYALKKSIEGNKGLRLTAGVVMVEPDGRMWLLAPRNKFAGYENTWIKGGVDVGESTAQAAVREMMEEAGFSVELDHYLGDYVNTDRTGVARMYVGHRSGGGPLWAHAKETYEVRLVTPDEAKGLLIRYGKPDERDQKILADAVAAMTGKPGVAEAVIPAGSVGELAAKTAPEPVVWYPTKKATAYGGPGSPKAGIAPEPPVSTAFGFDHSTWKSFTPTESPPDKVFPYTKTHWKLADGTTQTMYWQVKPGFGQSSPTAAQLFWANSKKQIADPHQRLSLHVAHITRLDDVLKADATIDTLRVNADLLGSVPGLRDLLVAAGATTPSAKYVEMTAAQVHTLADAIRNNTPLGHAGVPGTIPTAALSPSPTASKIALGVSGDDLAFGMQQGAYVGDINLTGYNAIEWGAGTTTGWHVTPTKVPMLMVSGPGVGWATDAERDMIAVGMLAHIDAVLKALPPGIVQIQLPVASWGDLSNVAKTLGLEHPSVGMWTVTPEKVSAIAAKAKAEMAAAGHSPALLDFEVPGSAVAPPKLSGLYKAGTVKRLAQNAPTFDASEMSYGYGKSAFKWDMLPSPSAAPGVSTFTFQKSLKKGPDALSTVLGIVGSWQPDIEEGAIYSVRFNKPMLEEVPGLKDLLLANGAVPVPGHPADLWLDEVATHGMVLDLYTGTPLPGAEAALIAPSPITGSPVATAAAVVVTPASSAGTIDALASLTEMKVTQGGIPLVKGGTAAGNFLWRRLGNDLELHAVDQDLFTTSVLRMGKAADEAPKVAALRIKPAAWASLSADERSLVIQAGGKIAPSGTVSLPRDNLLMLRDQMTADLKAATTPAAIVAPPPAVILPGIGVTPEVVADLQVAIVPQKQGFVKTEYAHGSWPSPVAIRQRNLSDTIVWSNVSGGTEEQRLTAGIRHLAGMAEQMDGNPKLQYVRFENLAQMPTKFADWIGTQGAYSSGTVVLLKREDLLALRDAIEPEMAGHAAVTTAVGGIASPPVAGLAESLNVPQYNVKTMIAAQPNAVQVAKDEFTATWPSGVTVGYTVDLPGKRVRVNASSGGSAPERAAATLAHIYTLTGFLDAGVIDTIELGPSVLTGIFGEDLKAALLGAGADHLGPGLVSIDKDVGKAFHEAIDKGTPLAPTATVTGVVNAPPPSPVTSGASLSAQLGYNHDDVLNSGKAFASDDIEQQAGTLIVQVPGGQFGWFGDFVHNKAGNLELTVNVGAPEEGTIGTLWALSHIQGKMASGAIADGGVLLGGAISQPIRDFLASQGWAGTETEFLISKADLTDIATLIDADKGVGKAVGGASATVVPPPIPKDPFAITGVDEEEWAGLVKGSVADTANVPTKANVYGDVVQTYSLSPSGAVWISTSVEDALYQTQVTTHSMAFLHDFLKGASDAGSPLIVVSNNVAYDDMQHWIADLLKEYGATPDGNSLVLHKAEADALLADMQKVFAGGPPVAVPTPTLAPAPPIHIPAYPAKYGFNQTAVETLTSIRTVTPKPQGFVDIAWGTEKAKYRQSSTTLTLVAGPKGAKAPEAWVDAMLHLGEVADGTPSVKQIRVALNATPDSMKMQMLTDLGKGALDGSYITVERQDFLAMRDALVADLGGTGVAIAGPPIATAADAVELSAKSGALVHIHVGDQFDWGGATWEVTALDVPGDKVYIAAAGGGAPVAMPATSLTGGISNVIPATPGPKLQIGQQVESVTGVTWEVTDISVDGTTYELVNPATGKTVGATIAQLQQGGFDLGPAFAKAPTGVTHGGLQVGDIVKTTPNGDDLMVTALNPDGTVHVVYTSGGGNADVSPSSLIKQGGAASPPPKMHLAYGVNEQTLAQYEADIATQPAYNQSWGGWGGKSYTTQYKDTTVVAPMGQYGYPTLHVVGAESTVVRIEGKRHTARWTIAKVSYGTEEQQTTAAYLHLRRMVADSAGSTPIFVSKDAADALPQIGRLLKGAGATEKVFANYGAGLDLDKVAVAKLKAKFDASAGVAIAQPIPSTAPALSKIGQPAAKANLAPGDIITASNGTTLQLLSSTASYSGEPMWNVKALGGGPLGAAGNTFETTEKSLLNPSAGWKHSAGPPGATPAPTAPVAPAAPAGPPPPAVPPGAIGTAPPPAATGTIAGPATAPTKITPAFLYGYDAAYVAGAAPADLGKVTTKAAAEKAASEKNVMGVGQAKGYWSVAPSGSKAGLWDFEYPTAMDPAEARSAAFAMLLKVAEDGAGRPKGFFIKPEFYDKVEGLRQMILDAGGVEAQYPNLGTAVEMSQDAAQKLFDALKADQMGPIKPGFTTTSEYLGFDHGLAIQTLTSTPVIDAKSGDFKWKVAAQTGTVKVTTNADKTVAAIHSVAGPDSVSKSVSVASQIVWLADQGASELTIAKQVVDAVPGLHQWLLTIGGKVDGGVVRLDDDAIGAASRMIGKNALPVGLGGKALPYSPFDQMRTTANDVSGAVGKHAIDSKGPVTSATIAMASGTVTSRYRASGTNIFWESLDRGKATVGQTRTAAATQLRHLTNMLAQDVGIDRLDVATGLLDANPGVRAVLLKYGAKEMPAEKGGEGYWSLGRSQALKLRADIEAEFQQVGSTAGSFIEEQAALIAWPSAEGLTYDSKRSGALAGAKTTAGAVAASEKLAIYTDGNGDEWLFKPGKSGRGAITDAAVSDLARQLGLPVPPTRVYTLNFNGQPVQGSLQKMLPGAKSVKRVEDLTPAQTEDMLRHSVLDWITNNDDGHAGNWLIGPDGHLWAIDKSRSYQTWGTAHDVLDSANMGNGYKPLMFEFFSKVRKDPTLLKTVHPSTIAVTMRKLKAISDDDFRRLMRPVAEANSRGDVARAAKFLDAMVARKNSTVDDFQRYFKGEVDAALKVSPAAVPADWAAWSKAGGVFNLQPTGAELNAERKAILDAKYGAYSPGKAQQFYGEAKLSPIDSVLRSYFGSGTPGSGSGKWGAETVRPGFVKKGMADAVTKWEEVTEWALLNVLEGGTSPAGASVDAIIRKMYNPKTGKMRLTRTTDRYGSSPTAYLAGYQKDGVRDMIGTAVGKWVYVGSGRGSGTMCIVFEVDPSQVFSGWAWGHGLGGIHGGENEFLIHDARIDQIISITPANKEPPINQIMGYAGPVIGTTYT